MDVSTDKPPYRKLTRLHRGVGTMSRLWLGSDHLLQVMSTGYTETYQRFYLRDIQCLLIVHTAVRTYIALGLALLMSLCFVLVGVGGGGIAGMGIVAVCFAPFLLWNHLLGPACRVVMVTAVQQQSLASLSRLPKTRRILAELQGLIEAAQADLAAQGASPSESASEAAPASAPVETALPPSLPPPLPPS